MSWIQEQGLTEHTLSSWQHLDVYQELGVRLCSEMVPDDELAVLLDSQPGAVADPVVRDDGIVTASSLTRLALWRPTGSLQRMRCVVRVAQEHTAIQEALQTLTITYCASTLLPVDGTAISTRILQGFTSDVK